MPLAAKKEKKVSQESPIKSCELESVQEAAAVPFSNFPSVCQLKSSSPVIGAHSKSFGRIPRTFESGVKESHRRMPAHLNKYPIWSELVGGALQRL